MDKKPTPHTPGPWPLTVHEGDSYRLTLITAQGNHYATTFDPAAARLIAAAPELLAALKGAQEALSFTPGYYTKRGPLADAVRAAIAKAEGK